MFNRVRLSLTASLHQRGRWGARLRNWEQGRRHPQGPARVLLAVIDKSPRTVLEVLGVGRHGRKEAA